MTTTRKARGKVPPTEAIPTHEGTEVDGIQIRIIGRLACGARQLRLIDVAAWGRARQATAFGTRLIGETIGAGSWVAGEGADTFLYGAQTRFYVKKRAPVP